MNYHPVVVLWQTHCLRGGAVYDGDGLKLQIRPFRQQLCAQRLRKISYRLAKKSNLNQ